MLGASAFSTRTRQRDRADARSGSSARLCCVVCACRRRDRLRRRGDLGDPCRRRPWRRWAQTRGTVSVLALSGAVAVDGGDARRPGRHLADDDEGDHADDSLSPASRRVARPSALTCVSRPASVYRRAGEIGYPDPEFPLKIVYVLVIIRERRPWQWLRLLLMRGVKLLTSGRYCSHGLSWRSRNWHNVVLFLMLSTRPGSLDVLYTNFARHPSTNGMMRRSTAKYSLSGHSRRQNTFVKSWLELTPPPSRAAPALAKMRSSGSALQADDDRTPRRRRLPPVRRKSLRSCADPVNYLRQSQLRFIRALQSTIRRLPLKPCSVMILSATPCSRFSTATQRCRYHQALASTSHLRAYLRFAYGYQSALRPHRRAARCALRPPASRSHCWSPTPDWSICL